MLLLYFSIIAFRDKLVLLGSWACVGVEFCNSESMLLPTIPQLPNWLTMSPECSIFHIFPNKNSYNRTSRAPRLERTAIIVNSLSYMYSLLSKYDNVFQIQILDLVSFGKRKCRWSLTYVQLITFTIYYTRKIFLLSFSFYTHFYIKMLFCIVIIYSSHSQFISY